MFVFPVCTCGKRSWTHADLVQGRAFAHAWTTCRNCDRTGIYCCYPYRNSLFLIFEGERASEIVDWLRENIYRRLREQEEKFAQLYKGPHAVENYHLHINEIAHPEHLSVYASRGLVRYRLKKVPHAPH